MQPPDFYQTDLDKWQQKFKKANKERRQNKKY